MAPSDEDKLCYRNFGHFYAIEDVNEWLVMPVSIAFYTVLAYSSNDEEDVVSLPDTYEEDLGVPTDLGRAFVYCICFC